MTDEPELVPVDDGVELALHRLGGEGPPLLFVHATGFNARTYTPFTQRLAERYTVWAPDLRGHGWSPSPPDRIFEWTSLATDLLPIVDHLGIATGELDCVGHSIGAATLLMADAGRPGLIRRMYAYEPVIWRPAEVYGPGENPLIGGAAKRREVFADRGEVMLRFASRPPFGGVRADALHAYITHGFEDLPDGSIRLRCRAADEAATYEGEWCSTADRIAGCLAPVVVAVGGTDGRDIGVPAYEVLAHATLVEHHDLGHFGPLEAPDRLADEALAALAIS